MNVIKVFEKYQTDKNSSGHNYAPYYAKHLPETATKILEVGVDRGESMKIWLELYPEAHVWGLDLFIEKPEPFQHERVTWIKGNQADSKLLDDVRNYGWFDFIVEDGSHWSRHQWMTFYGLWGSCDLYIVEDLHCAEEFWRQKLRYNETMIYAMKNGLFPFKHELYLDKIAFIFNAD